MAKKPTKKLDEIGKKFGADREKALNDANLQGALYMHVVEVINYFTQHPDENV